MRLFIFALILLVSVNAPLSAQTVTVKRETAMRSGPSEQSYDNGYLKPGETVNVVQWPQGGSRYATIDAPKSASSLIPAQSVEHFWSSKKPYGREYPILRAEETLIDGNPLNGVYLTSRATIPKSALVEIIGEKMIPDQVSKKPRRYYRIKPHAGERRFVHADDLEGGPVYSAPQFPTLPSPPTSNPNVSPSSGSMWGSSQTPLAQSSTDLSDSEQLPPAVVNEMYTADQAYREAMNTRVWEDARQRYHHLTQSPYASVRILAINRLEFIRQWQLNPPPVTPVRTVAEHVTVGMPQYPPTSTGTLWIPGDAPKQPAPTTLTNTNSATKQVVIRPDQPPVTTRPASTNPAPPVTAVPTYPNPTSAPAVSPPPAAAATSPWTAPANQALPQATTPKQPAPVKPVAAAAPVVPGKPAPAAQTIKHTGQLFQAAQPDGFTPLYYLVNSQGTATYYAKAMSNSQINLAQYIGRFVEVEGTKVDRRSQLGKDQINVTQIRVIQ